MAIENENTTALCALVDQKDNVFYFCVRSLHSTDDSASTSRP